VKAVLFDFGGTIDTDGVHWSEKFWEYYQRFGVSLVKKEFERAFVISEDRLIADPSVSTATFRETLSRQFRLQFEILGLQNQALADQMSRACYDDVTITINRARQLLVELVAHYRLGLVSNFYGNLALVCQEFGLDSLFATTVDSHVVGIRKPDPALFTHAINSMSVTPAETYVVGDSYDRDIVPSKQLGCSTIWLRGKSWHTPASTAAADFTVTSFSAIRGILLEPS
jgi:HAD superfamily hydrolase (TIGR01549 family)